MIDVSHRNKSTLNIGFLFSNLLHGFSLKTYFGYIFLYFGY